MINHYILHNKHTSCTEYSNSSGVHVAVTSCQLQHDIRKSYKKKCSIEHRIRRNEEKMNAWTWANACIS